MHVYFEPGTTIDNGAASDGTITVSAEDVTLEFGAGCTVDGLITWSGANANLKGRNNLNAAAGISSTANYFSADGGGFGSLFDGGSTRSPLQITEFAPLCQNFSCQSSGSQEGWYLNNTGAFSGGMAVSVKVADSGGNSYRIASIGSINIGISVLDGTARGIYALGDQNIVLGSFIEGTYTDQGLYLSSSDKSIASGNLVKDPSTNPILLGAAADDSVAVANRTDGAVGDLSTGSVVGANEVTTF